MNYTDPIKNESDAQNFLFQLHQLRKLFHPEDNPSEVVNGKTRDWLFTKTEAALISERMDEVFEHLNDPCAYALSLIEHDF